MSVLQKSDLLRGKKKLFKGFSVLVMGIMAFATLYPLVFVLMTSVKTNEDVILHPFTIPSIHFDNYVVAWKMGHIAQYFMNSVIVTVSSVFLQLVVILLAAYSFGKLKPWGHKWLFTAYLATMFVTTEMTTVPLFVLLTKIGLYDTRLGLILPYTATGLVLGIYILTNFIREIPAELDDAAIIDGAGVMQIMLRIDMPMIAPALFSVFIFNFQSVWSEFYWALIMIRSESVKTLPLGLINFQSQYTSNYGVLTAGLTILALPVLLLYIFSSNHFIEGISAGAVKG